MLRAEVTDLPDDVKKWVVARRNWYTAELNYFDSFDDKDRAENMAADLDDGVVLERTDK